MEFIVESILNRERKGRREKGAHQIREDSNGGIDQEKVYLFILIFSPIKGLYRGVFPYPNQICSIRVDK